MLNVIVGAVAIGAVVYAMLDGETQRQHNRFQRKQHQLRRESLYYREKIQEALRHSKDYQEYKHSIELHYASTQTVNQMFELYASAKHTIVELYHQLQLSGNKIQQLKAERDVATSDMLLKVREQLKLQRETHKQIKQSIADDKIQKEQYYNDLKAINQSTADFKQHLRLNTGKAGRLWYELLEQRRLSA